MVVDKEQVMDHIERALTEELRNYFKYNINDPTFSLQIIETHIERTHAVMKYLEDNLK